MSQYIVKYEGKEPKTIVLGLFLVRLLVVFLLTFSLKLRVKIRHSAREKSNCLK